MHFVNDIRRVLATRHGEGLAEDEAERLWGAILDEALDEIEVGAIVAAIAARGETREEALGLHRALVSRLAPWSPSPGARAIVIPAYGAVEGEASWVALAAMLLRRFGIPVVIHGTLEAPRGISAARVLREVGILPSSTLAQADRELAARRVAFVPVQLVSPAFAALLALRARLGIENTAHRVAQVLDPTRTDAIRLGFCIGEPAAARTMDLAGASGGRHLVLEWPLDDVSRQPGQRPRITHVAAGRPVQLFEADARDARKAAPEPQRDAADIARWIEAVTHGAVPLPVPVMNLVAACLHAAGDACDLPRAKALAALHASRLAA